VLIYNFSIQGLTARYVEAPSSVVLYIVVTIFRVIGSRRRKWMKILQWELKWGCET
jgi:hypothetical protein